MSSYVEEPTSEAEYVAVTESVTLPVWMNHPEPVKSVYAITESGGSYFIKGKLDAFASLEVAYDYVKEELHGDCDLSEIEGGDFFITSSNRLLLSFTDADQLRLQKYGYWCFLELDKKYQENPEDFYLAYHWLDSHPAFYYRYENNLNRWEQGRGLQEVTQNVIKGDDGEIAIVLEHGANSNKDRVGTSRYADFRLDVTASTFEEAYIKLAAAVNANFTSDGIDREIKGETPEWAKAIVSEIGEGNSEGSDSVVDNDPKTGK